MAELPPKSVLAPLFRHDAEGLQKLLNHEPDGSVETIQSSNGPVVAVRGRKLHSGRDPVQEARRFVRRQDLTHTTVIVLFGFASGYVVRALVHRTTALVVVFEPDFNVLHEGLSHGPIPDGTTIITDPDQLGESLYQTLAAGDQGRIIQWVPSVRQNQEAYNQAMYRTGIAIERARCRDLTTQCRVEGWLDFYLTNLHHLAETPGLSQLRTGLQGIPAVVCSAGPSLSKNVQLLAGIRDNVFIIAVNTAAAALAKNGIKPHAIVSVESLDVSMQLESLPWIREIPAFIELTGNPALFDLPFSHHIPISVDTSSCSRFTRKIDGGHMFNAGVCVATAAASLVQQLGCTTIVLLGQDLAYCGDRVYADGTVFESIRADINRGISSHRGTESKREIEKASQGTLISGVTQSTTYQADTVPGWGGSPPVWTNRDFMHFRDWFIYASDKFHEFGVRTFNCTEGGASITGWEEIPFSDVIEQLQFSLDSNNESVEQKFHALLSRTPTSPEQILAAIRHERRIILRLIGMSLEARALVDDDPDGDILSNDSVSGRLAAITAAVVESFHDAPLVRERLTRPIQMLHERKELTTLSLHQTIEQHIANLDTRLEALESKIAAMCSQAA